jgi:DNA-binding NtrC family response regulator
MNEGIKYPDLPSSVSLLLGRSSIISRLRDLLRRAATSDLGVLLAGEIGVGKELAAREIHGLRARTGPRGPFLVVDRAATSWPSDIAANAGATLYIEELAELPRSMQGELLHALQRDLRVIAATSRHPTELRNSTVVRSDLYYRVCECIIEVPPLRDRVEDIRALAEHFLAELGTTQRLSPEALRALETCHWPGNVRELKAVIRRAAQMHADEQVLDPGLLFDGKVSPERRDGDLKHLLERDWDDAKDEFGRWYWTNLWRNLGGDVRKVIEHADVSPVWLRNRRKLYELRSGGAGEVQPSNDNGPRDPSS